MLMRTGTGTLPQPPGGASGSGYNTPQRAQMGAGSPAPSYQLLNRASGGAVGAPPLSQGRQSFSLPSGTLWSLPSVIIIIIMKYINFELW